MSIIGAKGGAAAVYEIGHSLRLRASASAYLSRTAGVPTDGTKWTLSVWIKNAKSNFPILSGKSGTQSDEVAWLWDGTNDYIDYIGLTDGVGGNRGLNKTDSVFRDSSAHLHLVIAFDSSQASQTDKTKIRINGVLQSLTNSVSIAAGVLNTNGAAMRLGRQSYSTGTTYGDGYLSEINFIDGQALDASYFGETNPDGVWVPKKYTGTYGNNGFYLPFDDGASTTTLGYDRSGNGNDWTCNNVSLTAGTTYDWMEDTPTNNYCTMGGLDGTLTMSEAALALTGVSTSYRGMRGSMELPTSGKWYWEVHVTQGATAGHWFIVGMARASVSLTGFIGAADSVIYGERNDTQGIYNETTTVRNDTAIRFVTGDILQVAYDADTGKFWFGKNDSWFDSASGTTGNPSSGTNETLTVASGSGWFPVCQLNVSNNTARFNFGQRAFAYTPPTGFKALCTKNLPVGSVTTSGSFTGNANADGPVVWLNGNPESMTINGNAVTWGTHADMLAGGFKLRTNSASYNAAGSNTFSVTSSGDPFGDANHAPNTAKGNP